MAAQIGRKMRIRRDGVIIAGVQNKSCSTGNEPVDITSDDNIGFRDILSDPAVKSLSISFDGVTKSTELRAQALAGENLIFDNIQLEFEDGSYVSGSFYFGNYEESGSQGEALKFSATLESVREFVFVDAAAPVNDVLPAAAGVAQVGQTLTAWIGEWTGLGNDTFQWQENTGNWANIANAISRTFVPQAGSEGNPLRVAVTRTNAAGATTAYSAATAAVIAA